MKPKPEIRSLSPILQLDPRVRVVLSFVFAIFIALSERFLTLGIGLFVSLLLAMVAGVLHRQTSRRFIELNAFLLFLLIVLPFSLPGTPVFHIVGLVWSVEGALKALAIALKANTIMLVFATLVATMEPTQFGLTLDRLGCPDKLTHILFFVVRYLHVIHQEYTRLVTATHLRCFRPGFNRHTFTTYGYLVGMLIVKSLDRSERIFAAMKCRGFRDRFYTLTTFGLTKADLTFALLCSGVMLALTYLEWFVE